MAARPSIIVGACVQAAASAGSRMAPLVRDRLPREARACRIAMVAYRDLWGLQGRDGCVSEPAETEEQQCDRSSREAMFFSVSRTGVTSRSRGVVHRQPSPVGSCRSELRNRDQHWPSPTPPPLPAADCRRCLQPACIWPSEPVPGCIQPCALQYCYLHQPVWSDRPAAAFLRA